MCLFIMNVFLCSKGGKVDAPLITNTRVSVCLKSPHKVNENQIEMYVDVRPHKTMLIP